MGRREAEIGKPAKEDGREGRWKGMIVRSRGWEEEEGR